MDISQMMKQLNDQMSKSQQSMRTTFSDSTTIIKNAPEEQKTYYVPITTTTVTPTTVTTVVTPATTTVTDTATKTEKKKDTTWDFLDDEVEIGDYKIKYKYIIGGVLVMVLLMKK